MCPLSCESVEVRSFQKNWRLLHETHEVISVIVAEDKQNIFGLRVKRTGKYQKGET
jgi:hypothetical protein